MQVSKYGLFSLLGIVASLIYLFMCIKKEKREQSIYLICYGAIGAFLGAKVLYLLVSLPILLNHLDQWITFFISGFVFYGGLFGAATGSYLYCKEFHLNYKEYFDELIPIIPLFHGFARIGCFVSGCCYGMESDFGIPYYSTYAEPMYANRIPIQLIEACIEWIIFIVLLYRKENRVINYLSMYAIARFVLEFFRGDTIRGIFVFSTSQWISIGIILYILYNKLICRLIKM